MRPQVYLIAALLVVPACDRAQQTAPSLSEEEVAEQLAKVEIEPGQWETVTEIVSAEGPLPKEALQQMTGRRDTVSNCITPEQAKRPSANFLAAQQKSECTYQEFRVDNGQIQGRMSCSGGELPGRMQTAMKGRYEPKRYDIMMDMETSPLPGAGPMKIRTRTRGERVGECS
ncbi:MAG TPA: DUF3617 domain-containing protein [Allosphingosinicella sp.]|nr:DUF3617 domain-containing protein [Allosphingosinicella sp.]